MTAKQDMQMIIDHPSLVPLPSRLGWSCMTALFWAVWVYLWLPLLTLAAWSLGFYQVHNYFQWEKEIIELKRIIAQYSLVVAAFGGTLLLWALSEYVRFRNKHRRSASLPVSPQELAAHAAVLAEDIAAWQKLRSLVAYHDDQGSIIGADCAAYPPQAAPARPPSL